jgi:transposase
VLGRVDPQDSLPGPGLLWVALGLMEAPNPSGEESAMPAPRRYPADLRQRAVRLGVGDRDQQPGETMPGALLRVGRQLGVNPDTLRGWVRQAEIDQSSRPGVSTADSARVKELERELPQPGGPRPHLGCAYAGGAIEMGPRWLTPTTCAA